MEEDEDCSRVESWCQGGSTFVLPLLDETESSSDQCQLEKYTDLAAKFQRKKVKAEKRVMDGLGSILYQISSEIKMVAMYAIKEDLKGNLSLSKNVVYSVSSCSMTKRYIKL